MSLPKLIVKTKRNLRLPVHKLPTASHRMLSHRTLSVQHTLAFEMQRQRATNWCWAAVAEAVSHFYNPASLRTQCSIANGILRRPDCCPNNPACNSQVALEVALSFCGNLSIPPVGSPIEFADVCRQILARRPVACRIGWQDGEGHFVVIFGADANDPDQWLLVKDPIAGQCSYRYNDFKNGYGASHTGLWTDTYLTK